MLLLRKKAWYIKTSVSTWVDATRNIVQSQSVRLSFVAGHEVRRLGWKSGITYCQRGRSVKVSSGESSDARLVSTISRIN